MSNHSMPSLIPCRHCQHSVSQEAPTCPHCGVPAPANPNWNGWGYEYKSSRQLFGMPLIHIAFGQDKQQKQRIAKGILAIGQYAKGFVAIAQFGMGFINIAQFGIGVLSINQFGIAAAILGQFAIGVAVIAQLGIAFWWGIGQKILFPL